LPHAHRPLFGTIILLVNTIILLVSTIILLVSTIILLACRDVQNFRDARNVRGD